MPLKIPSMITISFDQSARIGIMRKLLRVCLGKRAYTHTVAYGEYITHVDVVVWHVKNE